MSDAYRAIYDAANLQLGNLSYLHSHIQQEVYAVSHAMQAPHVLLRAKVFPDGDMWCCLYGDNLIEGVVGFGETPEKAAAAFDLCWFKGMKSTAAKEGEKS